MKTTDNDFPSELAPLEHFDLVVIGSGAGGGTPATRCATEGWKVAIVDNQPPGGTCALRGCDPKKVLVEAASVADEHERMHGKGLGGEARVEWAELMRFKRTFTDPVSAQREMHYKSAGITFVAGHATFLDPETLSAAGRRLRARYIVVASGASPARLGVHGESNIIDSTGFLDLENLPDQVVFVGAGFISFEFAHVARRAGRSAAIIGQGQPLKQFDADIVNRLVEYSRETGIEVILDSKVTGVERSGSGFRVESERDGKVLTREAGLVVHGAGRVPNTSNIGATAGNVSLDERGAVLVNEYLQSVSNPRVYAAGDVALPKGSAPLTPVGGHEAQVIAHNILKGNARTPDYRGIPSVVFTIPPLASVGHTEESARGLGIPVEVKMEDTRKWQSALRVSQPASKFKTIVDSNTGLVLGAHLLGPHAEEVINIFAFAIRHGVTAEDLRKTVFAYPTSSSDVPYMI